MKLELGGDLSVELVRTSRRKTVAIKVGGGVAYVMAPRSLSKTRVMEFVRGKEKWIRKKIGEQVAAIVAAPAARQYVSGENFTCLGQPYRLQLIPGDVQEVQCKGGCLSLGVSEKMTGPDIRDALVQWYKEYALARLTEITARYAELLGVVPRSITVKDYKSRWGACSWRGDLFYNWQIIIAPVHVVEYLVVHELCHIKQQNHSPAYWQLVEQAMPDYKERRRWLRMHGMSLAV